MHLISKHSQYLLQCLVFTLLYYTQDFIFYPRKLCNDEGQNTKLYFPSYAQQKNKANYIPIIYYLIKIKKKIFKNYNNKHYIIQNIEKIFVQIHIRIFYKQLVITYIFALNNPTNYFISNLRK